jgi:AhpD family alkylhydroperoxidase
MPGQRHRIGENASATEPARLLAVFVADPAQPADHSRKKVTMRLDYQKIAAAGVRALGSVHVYVDNSGLPKALVNLVYLRCSQINGCAYCIDSHSRDLMKEGVPAEKLLLLSAWRESGEVFTAQERAALQWAEALTLISETHAPDEDYAAVAAAFSPKEVVDLTIAIGLMNLYNRIAIGFRRGPGH